VTGGVAISVETIIRAMSSVLQCVAVCCSVLQCVAVCCSVLQCFSRNYHTSDESPFFVSPTKLTYFSFLFVLSHQILYFYCEIPTNLSFALSWILEG